MRGFIRQRGATWTVYWSAIDPATGKRVQHTKGGFTRKEPARPPKGDSAREYLNSTIGSVQDGSWRPSKALTVKELLEDHWLPAQRSRELRPATLKQYRNVIAAWIVPTLGGVRVVAITPKQITEAVERLRTEKSARGRRGLSPRSAQLTVGVLKAACAWAVENGLLGRNPVIGVRRPRGNARTMAAWDAEAARAFLAATRDDRLAWCWALLLTRGLRRGEVCGLRWEDIDGSVLRVNRTRVDEALKRNGKQAPSNSISAVVRSYSERKDRPHCGVILSRFVRHDADQGGVV